MSFQNFSLLLFLPLINIFISNFCVNLPLQVILPNNPSILYISYIYSIRRKLTI